MHMGVILLTEATTASEARTKATIFMSDMVHVGSAEYFCIGGRWAFSMAHCNKKFVEESGAILGPNPFTMTKEGEKRLQELWESLGGRGPNPYASGPLDNLQQGSLYSILPLGECLSIVKEWREHGIMSSSTFSFKETNVFNIVYDDRTIPEELNGWWAVMVDYYTRAT